MAKPTILMIGNYLSQPKHNRNIWNDLAERLAEDGWGVLTTSHQENQVLRLLDMLQTILFRRKQYALAQIDVFSGKAFVFAELCSSLLRWIGKPVLLNLHGGGLLEFSGKHPRRVKTLLERASMVVTPSTFIQEGLQAFHPNIRIIPNPIDISKAVFRPRSGLQAQLIWLRAFHAVYNPTLAVRVLHQLAEEFPGAYLTMIGPDKGDGSLQLCIQQARLLGVEKSVSIMNGIPHELVTEYMNRADIFINTTNYDVAPRSVLEAMACGLCVVSTNVGGMHWLVEDGQDGLLVPPDDPQAMTAAIKSILVDSALASRLSTKARQKAESLDWRYILPIWNEVLSALISVTDK